MNERIRIQRKKIGDGEHDIAPPIVHEALRSPGAPLDDATRAFMEPRFGHGFGGVRVHIDERAAESADAVTALAYTVGRDIVFGAGQYRPGTEAGQQLIAHELAHVVQHSGSGYVSDSPLSISSPGDSAEHTARVASKQVGIGLAVHLPSTTLNVARQEDDEHSWWDTFVEGASGLAYGTVQGLAPGGFLAPSPNPKSRTFEFFRGAGQVATGITETIGGIGGEAGGLVLDATGVGALLGVPINIASAAAVVNGVAGATAGFGTIAHAMSMNDGSSNSPNSQVETNEQSNPVKKGPIPDEEPASLQEQITMDEAKSGQTNPSEPIMGPGTNKPIGDTPRLVDNYGPGEWVKMQHTHETPDGRTISIHWFRNQTTGQNVEFKFDRGEVLNPMLPRRGSGF